MGSGNGVKKESFLCAALKTEKRVSTAPVRADHVSGGPETLKNVLFFASVFRTGLLSTFSQIWVSFLELVGCKM